MESQAQLEFRSEKVKTVSVAGDFNDWCGSAKGAFNPELGRMIPSGEYTWVFPLKGIAPGPHQYKFVVDGEWEAGPNRTFHLDEKGRLIDPSGGIVSAVLENFSMIRVTFNSSTKLPRFLDQLVFNIKPHGAVLSIDRHLRQGGEGETIDIYCRDIDITSSLELEVKGLFDKTIIKPILLDGVFAKTFISNKPLGVTVEGGKTVFRIFAPRAKSVVLHLAENSAMNSKLTTTTGVKDSDGVWEMSVSGTHWGCYYGFKIDGPHGAGEGFDPTKLWPDPYSRASVFHNGPSILMEPNGDGAVFKGWSDDGFVTPPLQELIIWEASIRDLTSHSSSKVSKEHRGKYMGLVETIGLQSGIDHMKKLGINAVEFLPIFEFDDEPPGAYHWGYMPSLFFAPEASYASSPHGAQVYELKTLINTLHRQGIAVIFDVVYNHTGKPQILMGIDKKYYYRHDGNLTLSNFSGCGNDFKSENPMARRLILDSLEYWVREYHVDGFRFDLAELIDHQTLLEIEKRLCKIKPNVILIAEPWSFRGSNKGKLKNTHWASWNDDFRNRVKEAALGRGNADSLLQVLRGSLELWTASPWESVNYVESHDDFTLTDHLTERPNHDGSNPTKLDIKRNLFCAAAVLLSPGIPMIAQGQEMLRSKKGNGNSYNAGDEVNAVNYELRNKHSEVFDFYRGLIELRKSPDGKLLRSSDSARCRSAERIYGSSPLSVGLVWHDPADKNNKVVVLFNADNRMTAKFDLRLPTGKWVRLVGNDRIFTRNSINRREMTVEPEDVVRGVTLEVAPISVEFWAKSNS